VGVKEGLGVIKVVVGIGEVDAGVTITVFAGVLVMVEVSEGDENVRVAGEWVDELDAEVQLQIVIVAVTNIVIMDIRADLPILTLSRS
jgi:DUF1009 family protein